ncbi:hypothetical protein PHJA_000359700 [Phtheirospermum japonicum]|uniref:Uncharacterized protein n=1 Tax=Phtheirospermum japonicum TaxID=374723 RepID=A0A830BBL8_9LAMI|nr:hypothetical protein PHJA_000359700 [Phtheirospermum japonicum]
MEIIDEQTPIWEEIDFAENYLVCCMFDEAAALASSILRRLLQNCNRGSEVSEDFENEWGDMVESAGMVFVQSLNQLLRASEILKELKLLFGSLNAVPVQVFVTGVCFQMSEGLLTSVQGSLEEFLNNWMFMDDRYYPLSGADDSVSDTERSSFMLSIGVDEYLEVVELYVITYLATTLKDTDLAISWVEKANLPTDKRQELLRRLQSMNSSISPQLPDELSGDQKSVNELHQKDVESKHLSPGMNITAKDEILKLSRQRVPCFWWFRTIRLKLGNTEIVLPSGKLLLASLLLLMYYFTRKKQAALKRVVAEKAGSIKKALLDLWQLAFSYQVNPLAAVQSLPTATR